MKTNFLSKSFKRSHLNLLNKISDLRFEIDKLLMIQGLTHQIERSPKSSHGQTVLCCYYRLSKLVEIYIQCGSEQHTSEYNKNLNPTFQCVRIKLFSLSIVQPVLNTRVHKYNNFCTVIESLLLSAMFSTSTYRLRCMLDGESSQGRGSDERKWL